MNKPIEERLAVLEYRIGILEGGKEHPVEASRADKALNKVGLAFILFTASNRLRDNPNYGEHDEFLREVFKCEPTVETRHKCADEMFQLSLSLIDEASEDYKRHETKAESEVPESKFDFEKNAFERLKKRIGGSRISLREYNRLIGVYYSMKKSDSRLLLASLKMRFPIRSDNKYVWIEDKP